MKIHSSCEIEDFVETHLCKLCVILRTRVLRVVCPHQGHEQVGDSPCNYSSVAIRVNRVMLVSLCADICHMITLQFDVVSHTKIISLPSERQ